MIRVKIDANDTMFNHSFAKGLKVLFAFKGSYSAMSLSEAAKQLDMSISSAQRFLYTLEKVGLIEKSLRTRKYRLTLSVLELGYNYIAADPVVEVANPFLAELSNVTGETVNLTKPIGLEMIYISRVVAAKFIPIHMPTGSRTPMFCTAAGRAYMSALTDEEVKEILDASDLKRYTEWTETDPNRLAEIVAQSRRLGFAYNKEELFLGDMTLAAAVVNAHGQPIACVHVVAPTSRWTLEDAQKRLSPPLLNCARGLANALRSIT